MTGFPAMFDTETVGEKLDQLVALTEQGGTDLHEEAKRLRAEIEGALQARRPGWFCFVCWSSSWSPCEASTKDAIPDPNRPGQFMVCELCTTHAWLMQAKRASAPDTRLGASHL